MAYLSHWLSLVNKHPRKEDKDTIVLVKGHCLKNPSNKDIIEIDEIQEISSVFTSMLKREDLPSSQNLGFGEDGRKYDELIGLCGNGVRISTDAQKCTQRTQGHWDHAINARNCEYCFCCSLVIS